MNGATRPISARASVSEKPIHMYREMRPVASGCRAMASIAWPKTRPIPMPGPIAARPYPMAPALMLSTLLGVVAAVTRAVVSDIGSVLYVSCGGSARRMGRRYRASMCRLHGAGYVRGGQRGEDKRLQQGDQGLEQEDEDRQREGARGIDQPDRQAQQVPRSEREDRQQQVAGEHVPEEPHPERERLEDEEPEQLDRNQDDVDRGRHTRRDHVPEVAPGPLVLDAQVQVEEVDDEYQRPHEADPGRDRELEERDQLHHVHDVDEEEQRHQERQVGVAFPAQRRAEDLVPDGQDRHLAEVLHAPRDHLGLTER